jgi:hypothetical protein
MENVIYARGLFFLAILFIAVNLREQIAFGMFEWAEFAL